MDFINVLGPKFSALLGIIALVYFLLSFAPIWWPAMTTWRSRDSFPRRWLFICVIAALVYGVFSFLAFAFILPVEAYSIFVAPQLVNAGIAAGDSVIRVFGFLADYWWVLVPPTQLGLTWYITRLLQPKWAHICSQPPNHSFKRTATSKYE